MKTVMKILKCFSANCSLQNSLFYIHLKPSFEPNLEVFTVALCFKVLSSAHTVTAVRKCGSRKLSMLLRRLSRRVKFRPNGVS